MGVVLVVGTYHCSLITLCTNDQNDSHRFYSRGCCTPESRLMWLGFDRHGFVRFKHWKFYGELGLAGENISVWVYEGNLKVEYQATTLALYELGIEKKTGEIAEVKNPRRLETHFRSPQLDLWQVSETEWLLALRRPEPIARKKPGKIVPLAQQLVLPGFLRAMG